MIHRHLEARPEIPVENLPLAAVVDILERGDLREWQPLAAAVARDPWGEFAATIMRLIDAHPMYGTSPLWRSWIDRRRARLEPIQGERRTAGLAALRRDHGLTQVEVATRIGISQSDLSKLERRHDIRISTLRAYVAAIGGRLRLICESQGRETELRLSPLVEPPGD